jgi:pyruvate/2-oxoglutarate/acetoin dehydrogenase E1 component
LVLLNIVQAVRLTLEQEMRRDPDVIILGEDVGKNGGVFRATEELYDKFGKDRVIDTPLAESGIIGVAIGLALNGYKPIAEIQFDGFLYPALDQIIKRIYRAVKDEVPEEEYVTPLGKARIVQEGNDLTLISWGSMIRPSIEAAEKVRNKTSVEIVDLRTLSPIDIQTLTKSVEKTGRAVIVHEAPKTCGLGSEITALINEKAFLSLEAPIERITGYDVPFPLFKLEKNYLPDANRITKGIEQIASF